MKIIKGILFFVVGIIALALIVAIFVKKDYALEREVVINQPVEKVFDYIKYLKNQDNFSTWASMDPKMKKEFRGTDGEVGFVSAWESQDKNVGKGEQEITAIKENERIDYELRFIEPFETTDFAYMTTTAVNDSVTNVKWGFTGRMEYPMNLMMLFMNFEEMLGADFENGLSKLKTILEEQ